MEQLPGGVVDGGDVVGVEGMAKPEGVGQAAQGDEGGMTGAIDQEGAPSDHMQKQDRSEEATETPLLSGIEALPDRPHQRRHVHLLLADPAVFLVTAYQELVAITTMQPHPIFVKAPPVLLAAVRNNSGHPTRS